MKKLNGFNNGRDATDGIGGREPFEDQAPLNIKEKQALKEAGIHTQTYYVVQIKESKEVLALFKYQEWAEVWKNQYCATAEIEPFEMAIR